MIFGLSFAFTLFMCVCLEFVIGKFYLKYFFFFLRPWFWVGRYAGSLRAKFRKEWDNQKSDSNVHEMWSKVEIRVYIISYTSIGWPSIIRIYYVHILDQVRCYRRRIATIFILTFDESGIILVWTFIIIIITGCYLETFAQRIFWTEREIISFVNW